jgi:hypothetical protein
MGSISQIFSFGKYSFRAMMDSQKPFQITIGQVIANVYQDFSIPGLQLKGAAFIQF